MVIGLPVVKIDGKNLGFLQKVIGPLAEVSEILSDQVRFFRWKSAVSTLDKARKFAEKRGVEVSEVPLKFLVPFLEGCSLEEEGSELTEYWAKLLAGAMSNKKLARNHFIDILKGASQEEMVLLDQLVDRKFITFMKKSPGFGNIEPGLIVNALTTMRRIQLADHVEKSVLYIIELFEEDLTAEKEQIEEFLVTLSSHDHPPIKIENIVISDRQGSLSYGDDATGGHDDIKGRWRKTLNKSALLGTNIGLMQKRSELDALLSRGLIDRTNHNFDAYDGHGFFTLISPTPLAVEFICACRGQAALSSRNVRTKTQTNEAAKNF